jgi:hypothetical protein
MKARDLPAAMFELVDAARFDEETCPGLGGETGV